MFAAIGFIAFLAGVVLAIVAGVADMTGQWIFWALLILGLIFGLFSVRGRELVPFLVATVAFVVIGNVFTPATSFRAAGTLDRVFHLLALFVAPAAIVAAVKVFLGVAGIRMFAPQPEPPRPEEFQQGR